MDIVINHRDNYQFVSYCQDEISKFAAACCRAEDSASVSTPLPSPTKDVPHDNHASIRTSQETDTTVPSANTDTENHAHFCQANHTETVSDPHLASRTSHVLDAIEEKLAGPLSTKLATVHQAETNLISVTRHLESTMQELRCVVQQLSEQQQESLVVANREKQGAESQSQSQSQSLSRCETHVPEAVLPANSGGMQREQLLATEQLAYRLDQLQTDMTRLGEQQGKLMKLAKQQQQQQQQHSNNSNGAVANTTDTDLKPPPSSSSSSAAAAAAAAAAVTRTKRSDVIGLPPGTLLEPLVKGPPLHLTGLK